MVPADLLGPDALVEVDKSWEAYRDSRTSSHVSSHGRVDPWQCPTCEKLFEAEEEFQD